MIVGIGIDSVETSRIERAIQKYGKRFIDRIYSPLEQRRCEHSRTVYQGYASHFAAKEAVMKALETGARHLREGGLSFRDIEVYYEASGAPRIRLYRKAKAVSEEKGIDRLHISITTLDRLCGAYVIAERIQL